MTLPEPYFKDEWSTIYHGDCRDIAPLLPHCDLLLTDPPYPNLSNKPQDFDALGDGVAKRFRKSATIGTPWGNDISGVQLAAQRCEFGALVFCSFHSVDLLATMFAGWRRVALITWFQRNSPPSIQNAPHFQTEFIWAFAMEPGLNWRALKTHYDILKLQAGCMAVERLVDDGGQALHPSQKPIAVMSALLAVQPKSVLDPYCGTGTTLVAAKLRGIKAVGIELEERYVKIAIERLRQGVLIPC